MSTPEVEKYRGIIKGMSQEELETFRTHLLNYCGLDTFAMVKVWEKLNEVAGIRLTVTW